MEYVYYRKVVLKEHLYFAYELAIMFNIQNVSGNPHTRMVKSIILDYMTENNILYEPIYYNTSKGLKEVYAIDMFLAALNRATKHTVDNKYIALSGTKYNFTIEGENN